MTYRAWQGTYLEYYAPRFVYRLGPKLPRGKSIRSTSSFGAFRGPDSVPRRSSESAGTGFGYCTESGLTRWPIRRQLQPLVSLVQRSRRQPWNPIERRSRHWFRESKSPSAFGQVRPNRAGPGMDSARPSFTNWSKIMRATVAG